MCSDLFSEEGEEKRRGKRERERVNPVWNVVGTYFVFSTSSSSRLVLFFFFPKVQRKHREFLGLLW